jgi:hypothetical protein
MLATVHRDLWIADGPTASFFGFPYPTRMALVRLRHGTLWAWSPVALDDVLAAEIDRLGPVGHVVSPNKLHHLFLGAWGAHWPAARLHAPPGLARRRQDLHFEDELGNEPHPAWAGDIDQVIFHGSFALEEVVFFHRASRTAIFADLIQRFDPSVARGWRGLVMRLDGLVGPHGSTPRELRLTFSDRRAARRAKAHVLAWDPERVVIAHGQWARADGRRMLERALGWLG